MVASELPPGPQSPDSLVKQEPIDPNYFPKKSLSEEFFK
jgi:hypothetical protein